MDAETRFAALVDALSGEPDVTPPGAPGGRRFGASTLRTGGSVFAMLCDDRLVVKLPAARVQQLRADGTGGPFGTAGRAPMREWLTVLVDDDRTWDALAREALAFVRPSSP